MSIKKDFKYRGARALVILHQNELQRFLQVWEKAKSLNITPPVSDDPDYESMEALLLHVFRSARHYLQWIADKLSWNDPILPLLPSENLVQSTANEFINGLNEAYQETLSELSEEDAERVFKSKWGVEFSIESMLEHAVVHPMRHRLQIEEWIETATGK